MENDLLDACLDKQLGTLIAWEERDIDALNTQAAPQAMRIYSCAGWLAKPVANPGATGSGAYGWCMRAWLAIAARAASIACTL